MITYREIPSRRHLKRSLECRRQNISLVTHALNRDLLRLTVNLAVFFSKKVKVIWQETIEDYKHSIIIVGS